MASYFLCCFLLQLLFGAVLAVADGSEAHTGTKMFAFSGMSFPLFSNLTLCKHITLYRNGKKSHEMIAKWEVENYVKPEYMGKIYLNTDLDKTCVIWICNVDQTHSAKYIVQYGINTTRPEVELTIMENKQHSVCRNSPPNSPEKCFGNLTEDEVQKWLDSNPGFMKKYFGNLTGEQIGQEVRKWLADHPEYIKEYLETNYSTTVRTVPNKTTQKGDALPETSYSTTERTPQKETTQKGDALPDCNSSETYFQTTSYVFMGLVIVMLLIIIGKKKIALMCKKRNRNKKGQESTDNVGQYFDLQQTKKTGEKNQEDKSIIDEDTSQGLLTTTT